MCPLINPQCVTHGVSAAQLSASFLRRSVNPSSDVPMSSVGDVVEVVRVPRERRDVAKSGFHQPRGQINR